MKKHKVLVPILFILVFFVAFLGCSAFWKVGWWRSSAETSSTSTSSELGVVNNSTQELISVDTTFYNYRYDREIYDKVRDQGAQSCYDGTETKLVGTPFETFNKQLSNYYKSKGVNVGIYTGNFYNYYGGLPGVGENKVTFPGYYYFRWAANIANRTSPYNSVCQGIVKDTLDGFIAGNETSGTLMTGTSNSGSVAVPYFNETFLGQKVNNVAIGAVKENVKFPFRKVTSGTKKGYYEFDSTKDVVRFTGMCSGNPSSDTYYYGSNGKLEYYYNTSKVYTKASGNPQFLPFNESNTSFSSTELGTSSKQKVIDYGYGIRYNIPFRLSSDGKIDGKNMVFEFSGDDDVWIFLDGKLVLDLGGQHGKATGTIDFGGTDNTAKVTTTNVTYINGSTQATDTAMSDKILEEDTYIKTNVTTTIENVKKGDTTKHVITVFYMERGMFESNFHMAFNFVPEGVPMPEPTPTVKPATDTIKDGSLTVQNKLVFPTTTPDTNNNDATESKINDVFIETVKDLAEDDVFQYSIQNQGTDKDKVGDSEIRYPSGKLTVRENGATGKKKKSYLSFGTPSKVRIYFDMSSIQAKYSSIKSIYVFSGWGNFTPTSMDNASTIYYFDVSNASGSNWLKVEFSTENGNNNNKAYMEQITINLSEYDGKMFKVTSATSNQDGGRTLFKGSWEAANDSHPALGGGTTRYSSGLPYDSVGTDAKKFAPADTTAFYPVSDIAYEMTEAHLAATNSNILVNKATTSGITDSNGLFNLFYDDSATFLKQFATGSRMKVVQNDSLMTPVRYTGTLAESLSAATALTTFSAPATVRKTSDYYYTTVEAESKGADGTTTASVDVSYDGQYYFANGTDIPESNPVNITQTFTNTIKTGSLTISKELKGNMDADSNHSYSFKVTFSNVFGGGSIETDYSGSYILVDENGNEKTISTTDNTTGTIVLKPNQKAIISGIPVGTEYKIEELSSDGSAVTDGSVVNEIETNYVAQVDEDTITSPSYDATDATAGITVDKGARTISGVIPCSVVNKLYGTATNEFTEVNVSVAYTNQFGSLTITKKIAGDVNNVEYYKKKNNTAEEKTYTFKVIDGSNQVYVGKYVLHTYEYVAANLPLKDTKETKNTDDGNITLKEGQMAEIGGISLTTDSKYTITEQIDNTDIYFVESLKVTSGTQDNTATNDSTDTDNNVTILNNDTITLENNANYNATITSGEFSASQPTFDVIYTNRYSDAYIGIDKFIDKLYYSDDKKNYADYTDESKKDISYMELTNVKQSFIFTVKQYVNLDDAKAGNDNNCENSFDVVLTITSDSSIISMPENTETKVYKEGKTVKVLANRYYRIEEKTDWSWKYVLKSVNKKYTSKNEEITFEDRIDSDATEKVVILKTYLDSLNEIEDGKVVPIAEFYNALDSDKEDIEGDTDSIPNKITKE